MDERTKIEKEGLKDLKAIKGELKELKDLTAGYPRSFVTGLFYGAGWIIGSIIALALLGWFLSVIGLVPGLGALASVIHNAVDQFNAARH